MKIIMDDDGNIELVGCSPEGAAAEEIMTLLCLGTIGMIQMIADGTGGDRAAIVEMFAEGLRSRMGDVEMVDMSDLDDGIEDLCKGAES